MSFYNRLIIIISKIVNLASKMTGRGSGTAITGLTAERLSGNILEQLVSQIPNIVVITGTNGKTTTQTFLANIIKNKGSKFLSNISGANLKRGILSSLIKKADLLGNLDFEYAIFELEEATIPKIISVLNPKVIVVTNLFRDQLDAYGEIDRTQEFIRSAIKQSPQATLILNADDPRVSRLNEGVENKTIHYGLSKRYRDNFVYEDQVEHKTMQQDVERISKLYINDELKTSINYKDREYLLNPPGKFHAYNALASILTAKELGINDDVITNGINSSPPAFGRGENIIKDSINYKFLLVKNPAGLSLTLDLLTQTKNPQLIFMLNDNIADGKDVSWIWDAEMELINKIKPSKIICSGIRAEDMLLRIKYTQNGLERVGHNIFESKSLGTKIVIEKDLHKMHVRNKDSKNKNYFVLPTYTAMLAFRKYLLGRALNE